MSNIFIFHWCQTSRCSFAEVIQKPRRYQKTSPSLPAIKTHPDGYVPKNLMDQKQRKNCSGKFLISRASLKARLLSVSYQNALACILKGTMVDKYGPFFHQLQNPLLINKLYFPLMCENPLFLSCSVPIAL